MKKIRITKRIYVDYAATTPIDRRVLGAMKPYWSREFGNPGGLYKEGVTAKKAVELSRIRVAEILGARPHEIIFTGSGTEANNTAILGVAESLRMRGREYKDMHFLTSAIEHSSVMEAFDELRRRGARVTRIGVTPEGVFLFEELKRALTPKTVLVSLMYANNEIGTIEPLSKISKIIARAKKQGSRFPYFHTDASNAPSYLDIRVDKLGVDLLTLDGQKIYGPKGVGALYIRKGIELKSIFFGGVQEQGLRPSTENVPGIVGLAKSLAIASSERKKESKRLGTLRDYFVSEVLKKVPGAVLNGGLQNRLPNNAHFSFPGYDNEWIVLQLDAAGIAAATRSACLTEKAGGSYVIEALGKGPEYSGSTVRMTLGRETTKKDLDYVTLQLARIMGT